MFAITLILFNLSHERHLYLTIVTLELREVPMMEDYSGSPLPPWWKVSELLQSYPETCLQAILDPVKLAILVIIGIPHFKANRQQSQKCRRQQGR